MTRRMGVAMSWAAMGRKKPLRTKSKIWIELEGEPVLGPGRKRLLEEVDRCGSILQAAAKVGVSYRRAWSHIHAMERRLGSRMVESRRGGRGGGGTTLTPRAREMLRKFAQLEEGMEAIVDRRFQERFK